MKKILNILYVTGSTYNLSSGPFSSLLDTVKEIKLKGHSPLVIGTKDNWYQGPPSEWPQIPIYTFPKIGPKSFHYSPSLLSWMRNNLSKKSIDVVSLQSIWLYNNNIAARWAKENQIPYMVTVHGNLNLTALGSSLWKKKIAQKWFIDDLLHNAKCLHALNFAEYKTIRSFGLENPVCVISNGIRLDLDNSTKEDYSPNLLPDEFKNKRICLYLGRIHPIKGIESLIDAWSFCISQIDGWHLVFVGSGDSSYLSMLKKKISQLGLQESISFIGPMFGNQKKVWFKNADFLVLPSHSEGFAMVPLESLACKLPVLLTKACNFSDVAKYDAGFEVDAGVEALTKGLLRMLIMPKYKLETMGYNGYQLVKENYQWDLAVDKLIDVYQWLIGKAEIPDSVKLN